jgi:hypothetical protein
LLAFKEECGITLKGPWNTPRPRFNHRNIDIFPLIYKLLRHNGFNKIQQTLVRNH